MPLNLEGSDLGYVFEDDYDEQHDDLGHLQDLLSHQLTELTRNDQVSDAEVIGFLRGRRCGRRDLVQIEVPYATEPRVLLAQRETVIAATDWACQSVRDKLQAAGFNGYADRDSVFVRLVNNRTNKSAIPSVTAGTDAVQQFGNTIAVMAAVGKGLGGPDPVPCPLPAAMNVKDYKLPGDRPAGAGPIVAIIDTGIPGMREDGLPTMNRTDGWLDNVPRSDSNRDLLDCLPQRDGYLDYMAGHGTFVAGIVQRVEPAARIKIYRAADTDGFAEDAGIANALLQAVAEGARIVNLSLGMATTGAKPPPAIERALRKIADEHAGEDEVIIVAAAGNFGDDTTRCWPAAFKDAFKDASGYAFKNVVSVGALRETDIGSAGATQRQGFTPAEWSSKGEGVDLWTVAEGVRSTFVTGIESPSFDNNPDSFGPDAWALWSGTSFAAPQIAGAIARICHERGKTPREAVDLLCAHGAPVNGQRGKAMRILSGIPQRLPG